MRRQTWRSILFCCRRRCRKIYSGTIQFLPPGSFLPPPLCVSDTGIYTRLKNCTTNCTPSLFGHFFLQNMFFVFTNIYTCLRNCTKTVHLHFFAIFLQNIIFVFTNIYTCLRNCTTKCTPSLVCHFFCKTCSLFYKDLHPPEKLHHKLYAFTCLPFCSSYKDLHLPGLPSGLCAICDLVILFAKA